MMKTKPALLTLLFLMGFYGIGQINRTNKNQKNIRYAHSVPLPKIKATKYKRINEASLLDFGKNINVLSKLSEIPKPEGSGYGVLSATFTPRQMKANNAKLGIYGFYDGEILSVARKNGRSGEYIILDFKAVKGKTYRITIDYDAVYDSSKRRGWPLNTSIYVAGSTSKVSFDIHEGPNTIDFLTETTYSNNVQVMLLRAELITGNGKTWQYPIEFKVKEIKIRQLQD